MAVKKKEPGKALINWDEELAKTAEMDSSAAKPSGGKFIQTKGGVMTYNGEEIPENRLRAVVLDFVYENQWYDEPYNPDAPSSPACYAFARNEKDLKPSESCEQPQNDSCVTCDKNKFGSADVGKGKACANVVRLALIPEPESLDEIKETEVVYLKIPKTSKPAWDEYYRKHCTNFPGGRKPACYYITEISMYKEKSETFSRFKFEMKENFQERDNGSEEFTAIMAKKEESKDSHAFDYPKNSEREEQPAKKKTSGKFAKKR